MLRATLNEPIPLPLVLADDNPHMFVEAFIYQDGSVIAIRDFAHVDKGFYQGSYTPLVEGYLTVVYRVYQDIYYQVPATQYDVSTDQIEVCSDKTNILRILGMLHENAVFDQQVYDQVGNLTAGRVRCYTSAAAAQDPDAHAPQFIYNLEAQYTAGQLSLYRITRQE